MSGDPALDVLRDGARALARRDALEPTLLGMLQPLADRLDMASAAVFVASGAGPALEIAAAVGLGDPGALALAVRNPAHPVTRTVTERAAAFNVRPTAPGGPALRSHLPLVDGNGDAEVAVGVLALAHDRPIDPEMQLVLAAVADLAAVAVRRDPTRHAPANGG